MKPEKCFLQMLESYKDNGPVTIILNSQDILTGTINSIGDDYFALSVIPVSSITMNVDVFIPNSAVSLITSYGMSIRGKKNFNTGEI